MLLLRGRRVGELHDGLEAIGAVAHGRFTRKCTRRFFAAHASDLSLHAGRSEPKLTVKRRDSGTPIAMRNLAAALARSSARAALSSRASLASVWPSRSTKYSRLSTSQRAATQR